MRKLEIADAEIMQLAIRQEIGRREESRYDHRLHGVLRVSSGYSCSEVGQLFGQAATTVQRWVGRFERGGFDGLREGERSGRPRALDAGAMKPLKAYQDNGTKCRTLEIYNRAAGRTGQSVFDYCKQADGTWKLGQ